MRIITSIAISVALLGACSAFGKDAPRAKSYNQLLTSVPAAELPAQAAELVTQANSRDRQATTIEVVKAAVGLNPAAAPAIVGAIARAVPVMAAIAAGAAAAEQPKQASAIAKAAAAAAPAKAGKIVTAVCRAVPNEYRNIAVAVSQVTPSAGNEIVRGVAAAVPNLKPPIERALAANGYGSVVSVAGTLDQAATVARTSADAGGVSPVVASPADPVTGAGGAPMVRGPAVGPPYIPLSGTPTNVTSGSSGEVPEGGRNYAQP